MLTKDEIFGFGVTVTMITGINEQFYGWLCTFGNKAKVTAPQDQVEAFQEYVKKIADLY